MTVQIRTYASLLPRINDRLFNNPKPDRLFNNFVANEDRYTVYPSPHISSS
jgi:hypothetical protein